MLLFMTKFFAFTFSSIENFQFATCLIKIRNTMIGIFQLQLEEILKDVEGGVPEVPRVPIRVPGAPIGVPEGGVEVEKAVTQVGEQLNTYNR